MYAYVACQWHFQESTYINANSLARHADYEGVKNAFLDVQEVLILKS